jgi:hypothetical protein
MHKLWYWEPLKGKCRQWRERTFEGSEIEETTPGWKRIWTSGAYAEIHLHYTNVLLIYNSYNAVLSTSKASGDPRRGISIWAEYYLYVTGYCNENKVQKLSTRELYCINAVQVKDKRCTRRDETLHKVLPSNARKNSWFIPLAWTFLTFPELWCTVLQYAKNTTATSERFCLSRPWYQFNHLLLLSVVQRSEIKRISHLTNAKKGKT